MAQGSVSTLQAGRGLAALAVVFFHANLTLALPKYLGYEPAPFFRFGNSGVQFFFVLSGFVILLAHRKDIGRPSTTGAFLWKRFRRLYPPLWVVLVLVLAVFVVRPSLGVPGERSGPAILSAFLIAPGVPEALLAPEWTLRHEVLFYAAFSVLLLNQRLGLLLFFSALLLGGASLLSPKDLPPSSLVSPNHLLFAYGMLVCFLYERQLLRGQYAGLVLGLGILVFGVAAVLRSAHAAGKPDSLDGLFGIGSALLIAGLVCLERDGHLQSAPWLVFLGEASYSIYLVHYPVISAVSKMALKPSWALSGASVFALVTIVALAAGVAFHLACERPLLRRLPKRL